MSRFVQVLLVVISTTFAGVAYGDRRMRFTYPNYLTYPREDVSLADVYPDTTAVSAAEISLVSPDYDDRTDLIAVGEIVGMRHLSRYDGHPTSLCMAGGVWQYEVVFVKRPQLTEIGYQLLSYALTHGPGGSERNQPWVTIYSLSSLPAGPSEQRVIVFAAVDKPSPGYQELFFPSFWGRFKVLPDSLQQKVHPWR